MTLLSSLPIGDFQASPSATLCPSARPACDHLDVSVGLLLGNVKLWLGVTGFIDNETIDSDSKLERVCQL